MYCVYVSCVFASVSCVYRSPIWYHVCICAMLQVVYIYSIHRNIYGVYVSCVYTSYVCMCPLYRVSWLTVPYVSCVCMCNFTKLHTDTEYRGKCFMCLCHASWYHVPVCALYIVYLCVQYTATYRHTIHKNMPLCIVCMYRVCVYVYPSYRVSVYATLQVVQCVCILRYNMILFPPWRHVVATASLTSASAPKQNITIGPI